LIQNIYVSERILENVKKDLEKKQDKIISSNKLIREKISEAQDLFAIWGGSLRKDPQIIFLLNSLDKKIAASGKAMDACGISSACMCCDQEDGETCCGAGIENKYTSRLLLINLLFGNALPENRLRSNSCFFLSENGCSLKVRLVLCVNYLCLKIQRLLPAKELTSLQQTTGEEMDEGFILEEAVKKFIASQS
jgi:hypothetical protein